VSFNEETRRYESSEKKLRQGDWIAQALIMLTLARLEHGWGLGPSDDISATFRLGLEGQRAQKRRKSSAKFMERGD
jgi:hypothetical protein